MNKNQVFPTIFCACILYCTINRYQVSNVDGQRHAYIRSFPALCGKKATLWKEGTAAGKICCENRCVGLQKYKPCVGRN